jgi:multiple sugar transport system substrate-binding protein
MKKLLCAVLLLSAILANAFMLTSCGGGRTDFASDFVVPEEGYDGSEVTISFYHTMNQDLRKLVDDAIKKFQEMYPNIKVEHAQVGNYDDVRDQIKNEITAGKQPNIAYCYPDHVALYNSARAVVALDSLINSDVTVTHQDGTTEILGLTDEQKADFVDIFYQEGQVYGDDLTYTLPLAKSTEVLYYNKTFFQKNNLKVPTTWDEMEETCRKIKEIDPKSIPLGYDSEANWFITMCEQYGSGYTSLDKENHFIFNNQTNQDFVKRFRQWHQDGLMTTQEIYGSYTSGLFIKATNGVRSYMSIGSTGGAKNQVPGDADPHFEVGIAPIPQVNPDKPKAISQGPSLCIFKDNNPQEVIASWLFVKYITTNVMFQANFSSIQGYMPVIKSVQEFEPYKEFIASALDGNDSITALAVKVGIEMTDAYYVSPAFRGSSTARDQVGLLMKHCFVSTRTDVDKMIDEEFKKAIQECELFS